MFRVNLIADDALDVLEAINDAAIASPKLMETAYNRAIQRLNSQLLQELRAPVGASKQPVRWKSERQRRAYFGTDGFGKGIPYKRTGQLQKNFKVINARLKDGGIVAVENSTPYANFVVGDDQQPFHIDTGWQNTASIVAKFRPIYEETLIQTWFTIAVPTFLE